MADILMGVEIAEDLATDITGVTLPETPAVPYCPTMTISAATAGASLGNSLIGIFASLDELISSKADNLREIAQAIMDTDSAIAGGF